MAAGDTFAILKGYGFWAVNDGTVELPGLNVPYTQGDVSLLPTGWKRINDTANGYQVTFRNPKAAITSEERGRIGSVSGGDEGIAIGCQVRSMSFPLMKLASALQSRTIAAMAAQYGATEIAELDKDVDQEFMIMVEGRVPANSFFPEARTVRYIAYNVENTANAEHIFRHSGADAIFQPAMTLEATPLPGALADLIPTTPPTGFGYTATNLDTKNKRGNYFFIADAAA